MAYSKGNNPHNKLPLDMEVIQEMYLSGATAQQIARHFGVTGCPIYTRLKRMGITRSNSESHQGIQSKENNPNWKGGKHISKSTGYVITTDGKGKLIGAHRVVAEQMLGRKLKKGEVVHHINGDRTNNRPENLMVFASHSEHMKHHAEQAALLAVMEAI